MNTPNNHYIMAEWPLNHIVAGTTITHHPNADSGFNLAYHVDDEVENVRKNRQQFLAALPRSVEPLWLSQTHSDTVIDAHNYRSGIEADAVISRDRQKMPVVMTADCVPILLTDQQGSIFAAIHAGWQGLYKNIIGKTTRAMRTPPEQLSAWIGPCIQQQHYEVDEPFYQRFIQSNTEYHHYFEANRPQHYLADLVGITRYQLCQSGIHPDHIYGGQWCTYEDKRFFSYRRNGKKAGRIVSFIIPS